MDHCSCPVPRSDVNVRHRNANATLRSPCVAVSRVAFNVRNLKVPQRVFFFFSFFLQVVEILMNQRVLVLCVLSIIYDIMKIVPATNH